VPASSSRPRKRLEPAVLDLPVEKMRAGYDIDAYRHGTRDAPR
jgi:hypothetical protein